ncbi:MAG: cysteine desulfurase family protein [Bdellovibrionota bacterium]
MECELDQLVRDTFANPSSLHKLGRKSRRFINDASEAVARYLNCDPEFIYWTSGASEANSWALHSGMRHALEKNISRNPRLIVSAIEHDSCLLAAESLKKNAGVELTSLRVNPNGTVNLDHLRELLSNAEYDLVSVVHSSNETGVIQPLDEVSKLCREKRVALHVDCVQAFGKLPLDLKSLGATYATFSGHKLGAPKGVGFLVVSGEGKLLAPLVHGKQQKTLRGGTENSLGIAVLGRIVEAMNGGYSPFPEHLLSWHHDFESELKRIVPGTIIHGEQAPRLRNTSFIGFEQTDGDGILMNLDLEGICASSGSACTSGSLDPSHVLTAMGQDKSIARSSVRFSSGRLNTWNEFERVLQVLPDIVERIRQGKKYG